MVVKYTLIKMLKLFLKKGIVEAILETLCRQVYVITKN